MIADSEAAIGNVGNDGNVGNVGNVGNDGNDGNDGNIGSDDIVCRGQIWFLGSDKKKKFTDLKTWLDQVSGSTGRAKALGSKDLAIGSMIRPKKCSGGGWALIWLITRFKRLIEPFTTYWAKCFGLLNGYLVLTWARLGLILGSSSRARPISKSELS